MEKTFLGDCIDTKLSVGDNSQVRWRFGACNGPVGDLKWGNAYFQKCCEVEETATLKCESIFGFGDDFGGGFIEIGGHRFCDVFYTRMRVKLNKKGDTLIVMQLTSFKSLIIRDTI